VRPAWAAAARDSSGGYNGSGYGSGNRDDGGYGGGGGYGDGNCGGGGQEDVASNASSVADALIAMAAVRKGANRTQPRGGVGY
jgi:hypothetical protein